MSKKANFPKIDLKSIVGQIKSVIGSGTEEPDPISNDDLGQQMKSVSQLSDKLAQQHADLTQGLYELHEKVNLLYKSLESFRGQPAGERSSGDTGADETSNRDTADDDKKGDDKKDDDKQV